MMLLWRIGLPTFLHDERVSSRCDTFCAVCRPLVVLWGVVKMRLEAEVEEVMPVGVVQGLMVVWGRMTGLTTYLLVEEEEEGLTLRTKEEGAEQDGLKRRLVKEAGEVQRPVQLASAPRL